MKDTAFFTPKKSSLSGKIVLGFMVIFLAVGFNLGGKTAAEPDNCRDAQKQAGQFERDRATRSAKEDWISLDDKDSEWKTYQGKKYDYQLKYPPGWEVIEAKPKEGDKASWAGKILLEEEIQKVTFLEKEYEFWPGEFQVRVMSNKDNLTLEQWIDEHEPQDVTGGSLIQDISDVILNGKDAKRLSIFGFDHEAIVIVTLHKGYVYSLHFTGNNPNDPKVEQHKKIYDQMVSSFTWQDVQRNIRGQALTLKVGDFLSYLDSLMIYQ
ncbi:MAG: hypothetical protein GTO17_02785 [Candidatus Aminicenantes bacterium]|nr:hypothetical protein [Candidatus Aminicenantes bacterium]